METGTEVTTSYDPMLAKVIAYGPDRAHALERLDEALARTRLDGIETNLGLVRAALAEPSFLPGDTLDGDAGRGRRSHAARRGRLRRPSPRSRTGLAAPATGRWVCPCGPMDDLSFRLGNRALGNYEGAPGLECTLQGPTLRFTHATTVCVTGAPARVTVDGAAVAQWEPVTVPAGALLEVGSPTEHGLRTYILFAGGGLDVPAFLGSASTFTLGPFGGHGGRALRTGDVLHGGSATDRGGPVPVGDRPGSSSAWRVGALEGPHAAPELFTEDDIHDFYAADWKVHFNSARTGVRLIGPKPRWARTDGGEAGLHPSNIHDTPYSVGAVDCTGDMPVLLGPDGPSLGGFVCPATVVSTERWKLGQFRPGDTVRFAPLADDGSQRPAIVDGGVLARDGDVTYRRSGDDNLLVEFGPCNWTWRCACGSTR